MEIIGQGSRRCFGVARIRPTGGRYGTPKFFKMNPNFDMTGVVVFDGLSPETEYIYQVGWFYSDREPEELGTLTLDWDGIPAQSFNTAAEDGAKFRSFIFGSCRYLLRLLSGSWFDNRGNKTFRANQIRRVVFLSGDAHTSLSAEWVSPESNPTSKIVGLTSSAC